MLRYRLIQRKAKPKASVHNNIMKNEHGLTLYLAEVTKHIHEYVAELNELSEQSSLNKRDYRAAERLLQLLTEVSIGLAKHWLKQNNKETGANAYQTFVGLNNENLISENELLEWRKIIGLRNSLVHDYLIIDQSIVKSVIKQQKYQSLQRFCDKAVAALKK